jgi:hypothetical protein
MPWSARFTEPIILPDGRKLLTLRGAATYITELPTAEHDVGSFGDQGSRVNSRDKRPNPRTANQSGKTSTSSQPNLPLKHWPLVGDGLCGSAVTFHSDRPPPV